MLDVLGVRIDGYYAVVDLVYADDDSRAPADVISVIFALDGSRPRGPLPWRYTLNTGSVSDERFSHMAPGVGAGPGSGTLCHVEILPVTPVR